MKIKKSLSLVLALIMLIGIVASTNVFAESNDRKVVSDLHADINGLRSRLTGTVDLSDTITNDIQLKEGTEDTYEGEIKGEVEAGDLFYGAYKEYARLENEKFFFSYWKNLVMFGKDENTFPNATYTVEFPKNNKSLVIKSIDFENGTKTISSIRGDQEDNKVNFTFNLGNWNDYGEFFNLIKPELNESGHKINISIKYEITIPKETPEDGRMITCNGACDVYYFGKKKALVSNPVISITSPNVPFKISTEEE